MHRRTALFQGRIDSRPCPASSTTLLNRFDVNLDEFPVIQKLNERIMEMDAAKNSHPDVFAPT